MKDNKIMEALKKLVSIKSNMDKDSFKKLVIEELKKFLIVLLRTLLVKIIIQLLFHFI
ncbi:MAG: hypothetical protein RRY19_09750 [Clostridium sp.]